MPVGARPDKRTDEDWTAIGDAHTLMHAEVIKGDKKRYDLALAWAKVLADEERREAEAMQKVAKGDA